MKQLDECPGAETLGRFLRDEDVSPAEKEEIAAHLDVCKRCARLLEGDAELAALGDDVRWAGKLRDETSLDVALPLTRLNELMDDYEIIAEIGRGGMGVVYRARQLSLDRMVAVKVLPALLAVVRPEAVARFRREAALAARLEHTNIIGVHDFGEVEGTLYYVMRLINGRSLRDILREINETGTIDVVLGGANGQHATDGARALEVPSTSDVDAASFARHPMSTMTRIGSNHQTDRTYYHQVAKWIAEVAEALDYAHGLGVIHRDIKPANLLLSADGRMMIADFGLAKAVGGDTMTSPQSLLGTARYMSPEQVDEAGGEIDRRTDVYALGATLYELLAFRPMFAGANDREVLDHVLNKDPTPPHRFIKRVPPELEIICLTAVEKDPDKRYATAMALRDDLERWLLDLPIHARRPSAVARAAKFVRRRKLLASLTASLVAVIIASGISYGGYLKWRHMATESELVVQDQRTRLLIFDARSKRFQGRFETALSLVDEGLSQNPDEVTLQVLRANILFGQRRNQEALRYLEQLIARRPDSGAAHVMLTSAYRTLGDEEKVAYHSEQVERLLPDSASSFYVRAICETAPERALEWLNQAIELDPSSIFYVYKRAQCFQELGRCEAMLLDAERAVAMRPGWCVPYNLRGEALYRLGRFAEALRDFRRAIELAPQHAAPWYSSAVAKFQMGQFAGAIADVDESIRRDPEYAFAFGLRGRARAEMGDLDGGIGDCSRAIDINPTGDSYLHRATTYLQGGRLHDAIADWTRVIEVDPKKPCAFLFRGIAHEVLGSDDRAMADYEQAEVIRGPMGEYAKLSKYLLLRKRGRVKAAADALNSHVPVEGKRVWTDRLFNSFSGRLSAEGLLTTATTDDERCEAHYYIGRKALFNGRPVEARNSFARCVDMKRQKIFETHLARSWLRRLEQRSAASSGPPNHTLSRSRRP